MAYIGAYLVQKVREHRPVHFPFFCIAALVLVGLQINWALSVEDDTRVAFEALVVRHNPVFAWKEGARALTYCLIGVAGGFCIVAPIFSNPRLALPPFAWIAFGLWAAQLSWVNHWSANAAVGGIADLDTVAWFDRHQTVDHQSWSEAKRLVVTCDKPRKRTHSMYLAYNVEFGDRTARLAYHQTSETLSNWLDRIYKLEPRLPPDVELRRGSLDWECLAHFGRELSLADDRRLAALMRPSSAAVKRVSSDNAAWGALLREISPQISAPVSGENSSRRLSR
jgi:hypothetical protein